MKDAESQFDPEKVEIFDLYEYSTSIHPPFPVVLHANYLKLLEMYLAKCAEHEELRNGFAESIEARAGGIKNPQPYHP